MNSRIARLSLSAIAQAIAVLAAFVYPSAHSRAQNQPLLRITSPADGTVVHPGQTITVVVTRAPGAQFQMVGLWGDLSETDQVAITALFRFSFTVRTTIAAARKYSIVASGIIKPGDGADSGPISLDVEPSAPIAKLAVEPSQINFRSAGEQIPLIVTGTFSDGSILDVTESSLIKYSSNDPRIATVDKNGVVTAVGVGTTAATGIIVRFGNQSIPIPVSTIALAKRGWRRERDSNPRYP